jgi:hypothetical protein
MMEWISVEDRLPAEFDTILFVANEGKSIVCCGEYVRGAHDFDHIWLDRLRADAYCDPAEAYNVTHWMPLPEPPNA